MALRHTVRLLAALFVVLCSGDCEGSAEPTNSSALLQTPQMVLTALQEEPSESSLLEEDNDSLEMDKFEKSD